MRFSQISLVIVIALILVSFGCGAGGQAPNGMLAQSTSAAASSSSTRPNTAASTAQVNIPANANKIGDIQKMTGWESCSVCAGIGGNGPTTNYGMEQFVGQPSVSGSSAKFSVGGTPWGAALWWKQVGGNDAAQHFVYELDYMVPDPEAAQALEFDVNQNASGRRYIFGTECNLKGDHTWRVWDYTRGWISTGKRCELPTANAWHHLVWEFARTSDGKIHFIAVTVNGWRQEVNMYSPSYEAGGSGLDVAFQMDLDGQPRDYQAYIDNVTLTTW